jgi:hypothetical protein
MKAFAIAFCTAISALGSQAMASDDCHLGQVASLKLTRASDGEYTIPLTVAGAERRFILGLNMPFSAISGRFADAQDLKTSKLPPDVWPNVDGEQVKQQVKIGEFAIGPVHGSDMHMLRVEKQPGGEDDVVGAAGLDLLENFDVELNLAESKVNLFSRDHCKGNVVYWADSYASVPFEKDRSGHIGFDMELDGKKVGVDFAVVDGPAAMGSGAFDRLFGLKEDSPGVTPAPDEGPGHFRYPFKSLSIEGVAVSNPAIVIHHEAVPSCPPHRRADDLDMLQCFGGSDLRLHASVLTKLHLYFAFKEKMLYVTAADAHL